MNCKSVSVMIGPPFPIQPNLIYPAILSSKYWCYDFDARVFLHFFSFRFFVILFPFGFLTHYHNIDSCIDFKMTLKFLYIKFIGKYFWFKLLRHFLLAFFYLILGLLYFLFSLSMAYCNVLLMTH